ncbi:NB-ARC domain-containing protein [Microcoleus sp. AT8-B4]|uniref:NB-ARC domain-containing protein n=1 Tax=Microcoleus sp. AT8-B4 TaxID=2818620 RepID=UPI002FD47FED
MTLEEALAILDTLLKPGHLNDVQDLVFRQSWQGKSYQNMADTSGYDADYLKDIGSQLWRTISLALGTQVTKRNIHSILESCTRPSPDKTPTTTSPHLPDCWANCHLWEALGLKRYPEEQAIAFPNPSLVTKTHHNLSEAIDVSIFYGRSQELATLKHWILQDRCRLITLIGMGGIGKTALSVKLAEEIQGEFEFVIWKSLQDSSPLPEELAKIIQFLSKEQNPDLPQVVGERISLLIKYLQQHRCLIILDDLDFLFESGSYAGTYRDGFSNYSQLLRQIAETNHQSCVLIVSREKAREIASLTGATLPVRFLQLQGLAPFAAKEILKLKSLIGTPAEEAELIKCYQGNPIALKIAASSIQDLFAGNIRDFLEQEETIFNGIRLWLDELFNRLSPIEKQIIYWLAINREPVLPTELLNDIVPPVFHAELLESLESLQWRSLIEKAAIQVPEKSIFGFTQQPLIRDYITEKIIEQLYQEITREECNSSTSSCSLFPFLQNYALIKATAEESVRKNQISAIVTPLISRLLVTYNTTEKLAEKLNYILIKLAEQGVAPGYGAGNIFNLLCQLQLDLTGADFSDITIWQADMRGVNLYQVNFSGSNLAKSVFSTPIENSHNLVRDDREQTIEFSTVEMEKYDKNLSPSRIYEGMNIKGVTGLTQGQKSLLKALGAVE